MLEHAGSLALVLDTEGVESCRDLEPVLAAIQAAEEQRARVTAWEEARESVLVVLDRVMALIHREEKGFCRPGTVPGARARDARRRCPGRCRTISSTRRRWSRARCVPSPELVALVDGWNVLDDDRCAYLQDSITQAFGRPLALAALRGKLGREGEVPPPAPAPRVRSRAVPDSRGGGPAPIEPAVEAVAEVVAAAPVAWRQPVAPAVAVAAAAPVAPAAPRGPRRGRRTSSGGSGGARGRGGAHARHRHPGSWPRRLRRLRPPCLRSRLPCRLPRRRLRRPCTPRCRPCRPAHTPQPLPAQCQEPRRAVRSSSRSGSAAIASRWRRRKRAGSARRRSSASRRNPRAGGSPREAAGTRCVSAARRSGTRPATT